MDELIRPTQGKGKQPPSDNNQESGKPKTARSLWDRAYQAANAEVAGKSDKQIAAEVAGKTTEMALAAQKGGLGAYDQLQEYYKGAAQDERDAKEKERTQVLTDEELGDVSDDVKDIYNKYISNVFQLEGMKVTPDDPEWMYIAAELEDPSSSLSRTMIAAKEAAQQKKQRLRGMSDIDIRDNMYKKPDATDAKTPKKAKIS